MRKWILVAVGALLSACEFVNVQPVPLPVPVPMPATVRGSSGSGGSLPPTPQQVQAAMGTMSTQEICRLLVNPVYGNDALSEIKQRGDFTDYEIVRIARRELADGLSEGAIRCMLGEPRSILTRSRDDYDQVYRYRGQGYTLPPLMWGFETRIYFRAGKVVDYERIAPAGAGTGTRIGMARL